MIPDGQHIVAIRCQVSDKGAIERISFPLAEYGNEEKIVGEIYFPAVEIWPSTFAEFRSLYNGDKFQINEIKY